MTNVIERNNRSLTLSSWYVIFSSFDFRLTHFSTFLHHGFVDGLYFIVRTIFSELVLSKIDVDLFFREMKVKFVYLHTSLLFTSRVEYFYARSRRIRHESIASYLISSRRIRNGSCWFITVVAIEMFQLKGVPHGSMKVEHGEISTERWARGMISERTIKRRIVEHLDQSARIPCQREQLLPALDW